MTGRAYLGEVLNQVWLICEIHQGMSELLDKQVNAQKVKTSGVHASSRKPAKKVCDENETKKKRCTRKNLIHGRKPFIMPKQKPVETICTSLEETIMDTMKVLFV